MNYYRMSVKLPFKEATPEFLWGLTLTDRYYKVSWTRDSEGNIYLSPLGAPR